MQLNTPCELLCSLSGRRERDTSKNLDCTGRNVTVSSGSSNRIITPQAQSIQSDRQSGLLRPYLEVDASCDFNPGIARRHFTHCLTSGPPITDVKNNLETGLSSMSAVNNTSSLINTATAPPAFRASFEIRSAVKGSNVTVTIGHCLGASMIDTSFTSDN